MLAEFDLEREARALALASELCEQWPAVHQQWQAAMPQLLAANSPHLALVAAAALPHASHVGSPRVPVPLRGCTTPLALGMSRAGGESLHRLLRGDGGAEGRQRAGQVLVAHVVPLIGWLLLCRSSSHLAHVDPHPGNFRWDEASLELWVGMGHGGWGLGHGPWAMGHGAWGMGHGMRVCACVCTLVPAASHPSYFTPLPLHTPHASHPSRFTPLTLHRSSIGGRT